MRFQVERAWSYYRKAIPLLDNVSPTGKPILSGFFQAYSSLMREIEQRDYDVFFESSASIEIEESEYRIQFCFA
jgi:hypothetical protein